MTGLTADQCGVGEPAFKVEILDESVVEYAGHPPDAPGGVDTFKGTDVGEAAVCAAGGENTAVATPAAGGTSEGAGPAQARQLEEREPLQKQHLRHPPRARLPWRDQWLLLSSIPLSSHPHRPQSQVSLPMVLEPLPKLLRQQVPLAVDIQEEGEDLGLEIRAFRRSMR